MKRGNRVALTGGMFLALAGLGLCASVSAWAQDEGYHVGENARTDAPDLPRKDSVDASTATRVEAKRLARTEYVSGNVTWRANDTDKWNKVKSKQALREGSQIWAEEGGRVEIRFDDGSLLRLGKDAVVTFQTFYSDDQGEFTRLKLNSGVITLVPKVEYSVYQVDTPFDSIKANGPGRVRIGVGNEVEVGVRSGRATVESGSTGKTTLYAGDFVAVRASDTAYAVRNLPAPDSWERWNDERDHLLVRETLPPPPVHYVPGYAPSTSFWLSLDFPFGGYYRPHYYGGGRGVFRYRR